MIQVGKTLYIMNDNTYIHCEHDAVVVDINDNKQKIPVSLIQQIIIFGNTTISNYLIKQCSEQDISIFYVSDYGKYYGRVQGMIKGNIFLRQKQYKIYDDLPVRLGIVKNIVLGKGINQRAVLSKHKDNSEAVQKAIDNISELLGKIPESGSIESLRGIEGNIASEYFAVFDDMLNVTDQDMMFIKRSKHPPENNCNALLSFFYTMLNLDCISGLECFGLDPYMGYLHTLRSGRESLASDLIEEFRAPFVDQLIIDWINNKAVVSSDFTNESNVIKLKDDVRKKLLKLWEDEKAKEIYFPLYEQMVPKKVVPYLQAQLLSQHIRGDIPEYPPYITGD